jgi:hypothetical protein
MSNPIKFGSNWLRSFEDLTLLYNDFIVNIYTIGLGTTFYNSYKYIN